MPPQFQTTGWIVWAEPCDSSLGWGIIYNNGNQLWNTARNGEEISIDRDFQNYFFRVFGVRAKLQEWQISLQDAQRHLLKYEYAEATKMAQKSLDVKPSALAYVYRASGEV